ncbi:MAG: single-stranded-DNA-specific exonuclease RecJ [Ardenticatenia bacterium]|nr:single-stranded-DNA-specific exonuclease RecJ [Ardenticatenia bacterium]
MLESTSAWCRPNATRNVRGNQDRLTMPQRIWRVRPPVPGHVLARLGGLPPLIAQLLYNRGISSSAEARAFLERRGMDADPFALADMERAVERVRKAIAGGEHIVIHGDFDADGITATLVLGQTLHALGAHTHVYIPHRVDEGYGLNANALTRMARNGVQLVVSVDCGIRAHAEVELVNRLGMEIIVTDHHTVPPKLPPAFAVINPGRVDSGGDARLSGVGVAFRVAQALLLREQEHPVAHRETSLSPDDLLDLVAVGTVADVVPLLGENRALVWHGLRRLRTRPRPGLDQLMRVARVDPAWLSAESLAFAIGPRINAAGRLDHPYLAYRLLKTGNIRRARELAQHLEALNQRRQALTVALERHALHLIEDPAAPLLLAAAPDFHPGVMGLVASRLMELCHRPAVIVHAKGGLWRGSARSIPEFHITCALDACADLLERYGGHAAAAGFTVRPEHLAPLHERLLDAAARAFAGRAPQPVLDVDAPLALEALTPDVLAHLDRLRPFGQDNPAPVLLATNVRWEQARFLGQEGQHLRLVLRDTLGRRWPAIAFRQGRRWDNGLPERIDVAFSVRSARTSGGSLCGTPAP